MKKLAILFSFLIAFTTINHAQDWAQLERFKSDNEKIGLPQKGEKRVIFMGNSITEGWIKAFPEFFTPTYINRGISGQTTPQMLVRFRQDVINLKPNVVVILAGTNDIAGNTGLATLEEIVGNITSMTELAKANKIKVILCSVLPAYEYKWAKGKEPAEKISRLNELIKAFAKENKITYIDYYSSMVDERKGLKSEYSEDGVHPNKAGYEVMMPIIEAALKKIL